MDTFDTPPDTPTATDEREEPEAEAAVSVMDLLSSGLASEEPVEPFPIENTQLKAIIEAVVYVADEPLSLDQIAGALGQPAERIRSILSELVAEYEKPEHGVAIREVAGGFKVGTKPEHHDAIQSFVKNLKAPLKLSLPALETLAVIAYKQPVTAPEIMAVRGVQGASVLKTLLDRKLIATAGRKNVIGKPILYKTTKDFLIQFGLSDLTELPTLKELEDIRRMAFADETPPAPAEAEAAVSEAPGDPEGAPSAEEKLEEAAEPESVDPPEGIQTLDSPRED